MLSIRGVYKNRVQTTFVYTTFNVLKYRVRKPFDVDSLYSITKCFLIFHHIEQTLNDLWIENKMLNYPPGKPEHGTISSNINCELSLNLSLSKNIYRITQKNLSEGEYCVCMYAWERLVARNCIPNLKWYLNNWGSSAEITPRSLGFLYEPSFDGSAAENIKGAQKMFHRGHKITSLYVRWT